MNDTKLHLANEDTEIPEYIIELKEELLCLTLEEAERVLAFAVALRNERIPEP
jgi:hypothetical protein